MYIGPPTFVGGRNVDWAQDMASGEKEGGVLPSQCIGLENFDLDEQGILVGRKGTRKINSSAINSGTTIHSGYRYYKASTSTAYTMIQTGSVVGTLNLSTGAFTQAGTGLAQVPLKWITWNDNAYAFNGTGIYKFDGTTWSQIQDTDADCPDSVDGVVLDDVLFTARDGAAYGSRVPYSAEFDAETWAATSFRRVNERDGQLIMSLHRMGSRILCIKDLSLLWLYGSSIYDFSEEKITEGIGQIGRMASAIYEDMAFFQSNRGIECFNPSSSKTLNNISRNTCAKEITSYTRIVREGAVMCYFPLMNRLLVSYPDAVDSPVYVFFLNHPSQDADGNIWVPHTIYTTGYKVTAMWLHSSPDDEGTLYWASDTGYVYETNYQYTDVGAAITASMEWGFTDCGLPHLAKNFSRVIIPARLLGTLSPILDVDFSTKTQTKTTGTYAISGLAVWDSSYWDSAYWAEAYILTRTARYTKMNGVKASLTITHSYSDKLEIHPFKIEFTPKEIMRFPSKAVAGTGDDITFGGEPITW